MNLKSQNGFSLFELIVVLLIISVLASVVTVRLTTPGRQVKPEVVNFLERQQSLAVKAGKTETIYLTEKGFWAEVSNEKYDLPANATATIDYPKKISSLTRQALIKLYADGSTTLLSFSIASGLTGAVETVVTVEPISGAITFYRPK